MMTVRQEKMNMRHIATTSALLLGVLLAGCGNERPQHRGLDSVYQPVVQRTDYVFDLSTSGQGLAPGEATRLRGWFDSLHLRYGDKVSVDTGEAGNASSAVEMVAVVAATRGLTLESRAPVTQGGVAPGMVRVVLSRTTASVPGCPDFHQSLTAKFNSATAANFGCATNATLAAMIANPEDLVQGRDYAGRSSTAAESANALSDTAIDIYHSKIGQQAGQVKSESTGGK